MCRKVLFILICAILLCNQETYAAGLSTTFGQVRVDNISIGQIYSMEEEANTPLVIKNTSDNELVLQIDILIPKENELLEGYQAIPDIDWITIETRDFLLPPQGEISTDVLITVPPDERYKGKKYQVHIWSHTIGDAIGIGLRSKLLISIAE